MKLAVGQINTTIGDFEHNTCKILEYSNEASSRGADVICFPELAICGYPPLDLLDRPSFIDRNLEALNVIANDAPESLDIIVGYLDKNSKSTGKPIYNAAARLRDGAIRDRYYKNLLPSYNVFNETRYFEPGNEPTTLDLEKKSAVTICEDIWNDPDFLYGWDRPQYETNPLETAGNSDCDVVFNLSASPFIREKDRDRTEMIEGLAEKHNTAIVFANMVGGNDSLIFDGTSLVVNARGDRLAQAKTFEEDLILADLDSSDTTTREFFPADAGVYNALAVGVSNYAIKSGYSEAVLGLSGGIDSALTATIAADALGPDNVLGVKMPSLTSSQESVEHADILVERLGIQTRTVDIGDLFQGYLDVLSNSFDGFSETESGGIENKNQHRIRGNILTTLANKFGYLPLCPGNKTELALGYTTLYGDLTGILAPLADVPKTMIFELARWRNTQSDVIPEEIIEKPPSAELTIGQNDEEDLGSYETIDAILHEYFEEQASKKELLDDFPEDLVERVLKMINLSEYKRRQAPTGLKVTSKRNFGSGRSVPEVHHFNE